MKKIIFASLMLLASNILFAQQNFQSLKVGDVVPKYLWDARNFSFENGIVSTRTLRQFKGKIIVLDFWATWCGPCVADMPKQKLILKNYDKQIEVLRISYEKKEVVQSFYRSKKNLLGKELTSIISDSLLNKYFPHTYIPHLVWIDKQGKILGFTTAESFTKDNIDNVIAGENPLISYYDLKPNTPLFMKEPPKQAVAINIIVKGKITGLGAGFEKRDANESSGILVKNSTLKNTYSMIARKIFTWCSPARMLLKFENEVDFENLEYVPDELWNIDFWQPKADSGNLYQNLLSFLNTNSGYSSSMEMTNQQCFILKYDSAYHCALRSKGGVADNRTFRGDGKLVNGKLEWFRGRFEVQPWVHIPVVDETGIDFPIDLYVPSCSDVIMLNNYLKVYGINVVLENRLIPMFVVRRKAKS